MKGKKEIELNPISKVFILLVLTSLAILLFAFGGSFAYEKVLKPEDKLPKGAMVGTVSVGGLKESEAIAVLEKHIAQWQDQAVIEIHYFEESVSIPTEQLQFNVEESVRIAIETGYSYLKPEITLALLEEKISEFTYPNIKQSVGLQALKDDFEQQLATLKHETLILDLNEYFQEESQLKPTMIASVSKNVPDSQAYLSQWVDALNGTVINGHSVFSLLETLEEQGRTPSKSKELNILASSVYELLLQTNFPILERHIGREVPAYADLGFEAIAIPNKADLKLVNPNIYDYEIGATFENDTLNISLTGIPFVYTYDVVAEEEVVEPRTIVHFSSKRSIGEIETIRYGENGYLIDVHKIIRGVNNELLNKIKISEDYYPPVHQIEERSLHVPQEQEVEIEIIPDDESDTEDSMEQLPIGEQPIYEDPMTGEVPIIEEPVEQPELEKPIIDDPLEEPPVQK